VITRSPNVRIAKLGTCNAHILREQHQPGNDPFSPDINNLIHHPYRPSNARIHKLEEENARLRQQLHSQSPVRISDHRSCTSSQPENGPTTSNSTPVSASPTTVVSLAHEQPQSIHANVVSLAYSPTTTGQPEDHAFHGPSAGTVQSSTNKAAYNHPDSAESSAVKNQLLAETTRQREGPLLYQSYTELMKKQGS
jgi:hypothetical protein